MQAGLVIAKSVPAVRRRNEAQTLLHREVDKNGLCIHTLTPNLQHGVINSALEKACIGLDGQCSCFTSHQRSIRGVILKPGRFGKQACAPMQVCRAGIGHLHSLRRAISHIHFSCAKPEAGTYAHQAGIEDAQGSKRAAADQCKGQQDKYDYAAPLFSGWRSLQLSPISERHNLIIYGGYLIERLERGLTIACAFFCHPRFCIRLRIQNRWEFFDGLISFSPGQNNCARRALASLYIGLRVGCLLHSIAIGRGEGEHIVVAFGGFFCQRAQDDRLYLLRDIGVPLAQRRRQRAQVSVHNGVQIARKGEMASQQLVTGDGQRVLVAGRARLLQPLFRRGIGGRSHVAMQGSMGIAIQNSRDAEIRQQKMIVAIQQKISRFDIQVNQVMLVRVLQSGCRALNKGQQLLRREQLRLSSQG